MQRRFRRGDVLLSTRAQRSKRHLVSPGPGLRQPGAPGKIAMRSLQLHSLHGRRAVHRLDKTRDERGLELNNYSVGR